MAEPTPTSSAAGSPDPLADLEIPEPLRASVERHRANLRKLVDTLKSTGMSEAQIEASLAAVVASYKTELLAAMKTLLKSDHV